MYEEALKLQDVVLLYDGVLESFNFYEELLSKLDLVLKAVCDSSQNSKNYIISDLENEHKIAFEKKDVFEKHFEKELDDFNNKYKQLIPSCLNAIFEVIKSRDDTVIYFINFL